MTAYLTFASEGISLENLVLAAGARWNIERCFQESKSQLGLDQYEVRTWTGWHRHITLVMAAYALLVTLRRQLKKPVAEPGWARLVVLSLAEMRRWLCLTAVAWRRRGVEIILHWSLWRRLHQRTAQYHHWMRRQRVTGTGTSMSLSDYLQL
ncbi:hypothetical protein [Modicisalibacter xianhensis]|uniref:hypothetical protein n=1 Tax=Modicisalibacter xianhensis TaxID=442341 RepID=UPI001063F776|nr:hypothetical protein [Halomonas xianhensis]